MASLNGLKIADPIDETEQMRSPDEEENANGGRFEQLTEGIADAYAQDEEPAPDEETTESIISHASNVLQDTSMKQEDRLIRVYSEVGQFLENKGLMPGHIAAERTAQTAIEQWKQFGKPEWLLRDGGARFQVKSSEKTADRMNVENPEQAFRDNPDKYVVHVALQALEGLAGGKVTYTNIKPAEAVLAKVLKAGGIQYSEFTQLGYDDISFEVKDQAAAVKATDYLNSKLPKSTQTQGYGYGTAEPAQAWAYIQDSDAQEGDEYSHPGDWHYPESTL